VAIAEPARGPGLAKGSSSARSSASMTAGTLQEETLLPSKRCNFSPGGSRRTPGAWAWPPSNVRPGNIRDELTGPLAFTQAWDELMRWAPRK